MNSPSDPINSDRPNSEQLSDKFRQPGQALYDKIVEDSFSKKYRKAFADFMKNKNLSKVDELDKARILVVLGTSPQFRNDFQREDVVRMYQATQGINNSFLLFMINGLFILPMYRNMLMIRHKHLGLTQTNFANFRFTFAATLFSYGLFSWHIRRTVIPEVTAQTSKYDVLSPRYLGFVKEIIEGRDGA